MSILLSTWVIAEEGSKNTCKWHMNSPHFNNYSLLTGGVPFSSPDWRSRGIHVLSNVYSKTGLHDFNDLRLSNQSPGTSLFLYFQLQSSGVPWNSHLTAHPLHSILYNRGQKKGLVFRMYSLIGMTLIKPSLLYMCGLVKWSTTSEVTHWTGKRFGPRLSLLLKTQTTKRSISITSIGLNPLQGKTFPWNVYHLQFAPCAQMDL